VCQLPELESPELYGLNEHVYINDANRILSDILSLSENTSIVQGHSSSEVLKVTNEITSNLQDQFKVSEILLKYPMTYEHCMNTVLI